MLTGITLVVELQSIDIIQAEHFYQCFRNRCSNYWGLLEQIYDVKVGEDKGGKSAFIAIS